MLGINEVIDDTAMRDVNDHLLYKTYIVNFVNFKQVELSELEPLNTTILKLKKLTIIPDNLRNLDYLL